MSEKQEDGSENKPEDEDVKILDSSDSSLYQYLGVRSKETPEFTQSQKHHSKRDDKHGSWQPMAPVKRPVVNTRQTIGFEAECASASNCESSSDKNESK